MLLRIVTAFIVVAPWACACHPHTQSPQHAEEPASSDDPSAVLKPVNASIDPSTKAPASAIENGRIGPFIVGQPLPYETLSAPVDSQYRTRLYADAQPLEGFESSSPPLIAYVTGGPFPNWVNGNLPNTTPPKEVRDEAIAKAREGKLRVTMLVVTDPSLRTAEGIGVGSRPEELWAAYPKATLRMLPGLWEEPTCLVRVPGNPSIGFFFSTCKRTTTSEPEAASANHPVSGTVIRVVVRDNASN